MLKHNIDLVGVVKYQAQAQYVAEAGIMHALARIKNENFGSRSNFNNNLSVGSYRVTFSKIGDRYLVGSVGTVGTKSDAVSVEIEDYTPSAMYTICSAGNDLKINAFIAGAEVNGDIHANNNIDLKAAFIFSRLDITGTVSAGGLVKEGSRLHVTDGWSGGLMDRNVYINGANEDNATVDEGADRKKLPSFNYQRYREEAVDSGDYYDTDQVFNGETFTPANGIVFVDGDVNMQGTCIVNGGIIANSIEIVGTLTQTKSGNRNVIISRAGDIGVRGRLNTEEAVVYAERDIRSLEIGADIEINGVMLARRDIYMWNFLTTIDYNYLSTSPADMGDKITQPFGIVSWNE